MCLLLWACLSANGSEVHSGYYTETPFTKPIKGSLHVIGYLEANGPQELSNLAAKPDEAWTPCSSAPSFGFSSAVHWVRIRVFNFEAQPSQQVLEVANPILNRCNLYEIKGSHVHHIHRGGDDLPFATRRVKHVNHVIPLDLAPYSSRDFLLEVSSAGEQLLVPLRLLTPEALTKIDEKDRLLRGTYFGIVLFVLLFNLFLYAVIKESSTLWYVVYVFMLLMLQLSLGGFAFQYLWPNSPYLANVANPFFASFSILALILFTQQFLKLREFLPRLNRVYQFIAMAVGAIALLSLVYTPATFQISVLAINSLVLLLNILILPTVIAIVKRGFKPARFFLLAFIVLVASVFFFILTNFGWIQSEFYNAYGLLIGSAAEVILLSFAVVDRFKSFRDDAYERLVTINSLKAHANEVLEQKVQERTEEITVQKQVVERQKEEIVDSIRYAERIQKALIPREEALHEFFGDGFVFFKPRDIVSGDFYWFGKTAATNPWQGRTGHRLFATADCTGHGVPGAMMSVLGYNALEKALATPLVDDPAKMLDLVNSEILRALNERGEQGLRDGMDLSLCAYHPESQTLQFAGARNNLYILRGGDFMVLKGDRVPIGHRWEMGEAGHFTCQSLELQPGDTLYAFTDGFPDQFGGAHNKKLKSRPLLEMIQQVAHHSLAEQKLLLHRTFELWKGSEAQTDDVCMVAVRV